MGLCIFVWTLEEAFTTTSITKVSGDIKFQSRYLRERMRFTVTKATLAGSLIALILFFGQISVAEEFR